jgi:hypothetical protein
MKSAVDTSRLKTVMLAMNLTALFILNLLILISAVITPRHFVIPLTILVISILYWLLRNNQNVVAFYFGLSFATVFWIIICENIVTVDNVLGTGITRNLTLGPELSAYADVNLRSETGRKHFHQCCNDPLSFNLRPGSTYRHTYDCPTCNKPYETVVDETGYLNQQPGLMVRSNQIDLFVAGDSVMQGWGMPSVLELLRERIPIKMWNLSIEGYGARQKVNALITYALPKRPKWVIVEFYSGNDPSDAVENDLCATANDFRCGYNEIALSRIASAHPVYGPLVQESNRIHAFDHYAENSFTLAVTRYFIHAGKDLIRNRLMAGTRESSAGGAKSDDLPVDFPLGNPGATPVYIRSGKLPDWVKAGMTLVHRDYERLVATVAGMDTPPKIVLLYNPTGYEIYRDILFDRNSKHDEISEIQLQAQRSFAKKHDWLFLDLTEPLRNEVRESKTWIFGRYDAGHWSHKGTAVVASVLASELSTILTN